MPRAREQHRRFRRLCLGAVASVPAWHLVGARADETKPWMRWLADLRSGGLVIYFRHGATNQGGIDRLEWPRERQRLLSELGERQARNVGEAFRRHRWPADEVLASPMARCADFARIAFGRATEDPMLLGLLTQDRDRQARIEHSLALLRRPVAAGSNRILVGHNSNIGETTGVHLSEGGAAMVRPNAAGFEVVGVVAAMDWEALAAHDGRAVA